LAGLLKKGRGLLVAHALVPGGDAEAPRAWVAEAATEVLRLHLQEQGIQGFARAIVLIQRLMPTTRQTVREEP
jgi:hypothetical protein